MGAVLLRVRSELRRTWRQLVALALLVGITGGIAIAAAAGARRTSTAFRRGRLAARAHDVTLASGAPLVKIAEEIGALASVESHGTVAGLGLTIIDPKPPVDRPSNLAPPPYGIADGSFGRTIDRPKLISGRMPDYSRPDEVLVNLAFARDSGVGPGRTITVQRFADPSTPNAPPVRATVRVTGVGVFPTEIVPVSRFDGVGFAFFTPAFFDRYGGSEQALFVIAHFRLRPGVSPDAFHADADRILRRNKYPVSDVIFSTEEQRLTRIGHATSPLSLALVIFAIVVGAVGLLLIGQATARHIFVSSSEYPTLRAMGMSSGALVLVLMTRVAMAVTAGGALAVCIAIAASPLAPIGAARLAEPTPGVRIDPVVLTSGGVAIVIALLGVALIPAIRAARGRTRPDARARSSRVVRALGGVTPPTFSTGLRLALEPGSGRSAVPVRSTISGAIAATAAVIATMAFASSLTHLIGTPASYGQTWDVAIDSEFFSIPAARQAALVADDRIAGLTGGRYGALFVGARTIPAVGLDRLKGDVYLRLLSGRAPSAPDEVALGARTLADLHKHLGDRVVAHASFGERPFRIVGIAVFPRLGPGIFTPTGLGEGAAVVGDQMKDPTVPDYTFLLARARSAAVKVPVIARMRSICATNGGICSTELFQRPADIGTYESVSSVPIVLGALLALIGVAVLGNALVTSVRRRRGQLAILKTIGFVRRQVVGAVVWQAAILVAAAGIIGIPLGVAVARWAWTRFTASVGAPSEPRVSLAALAAFIPIAVAIAGVIASIPARAAARTAPASVLRTE